MNNMNVSKKMLTLDVIAVYLRVWFQFSFWPIALIAVLCYFGMPYSIGLGIGAIVLIFTTGGALINFLCYLGNQPIPKIL